MKYSFVYDNFFITPHPYNCCDTPVEFDQLSDKIYEKQTELMENSKSKVVDQEIKLTVSGPDFDDLVYVDLTGIIHNGDGETETRAMIERYIEPQKSLIMVVTEAKQDDEGACALKLALKHDPDGIRTLRIMTKFDCFDTPVNEADTVNDINEAFDIGKATKTEEMSPHAVICCVKGDKYSSEKELNHFKSLAGTINPSRCDVTALKSRLPRLLCNLIETNLPRLLDQIKTILDKNQEMLNKIGQLFQKPAH